MAQKIPNSQGVDPHRPPHRRRWPWIVALIIAGTLATGAIVAAAVPFAGEIVLVWFYHSAMQEGQKKAKDKAAVTPKPLDGVKTDKEPQEGSITVADYTAIALSDPTGTDLSGTTIKQLLKKFGTPSDYTSETEDTDHPKRSVTWQVGQYDDATQHYDFECDITVEFIDGHAFSKDATGLNKSNTLLTKANYQTKLPQLHKGMTEAQVIALCGTTDTQRETKSETAPDEAVWLYSWEMATAKYDELTVTFENGKVTQLERGHI